MGDARKDEDTFYSRYEWCLNPILSIRELLDRLKDELDHYRAATGWQREECKINLYLFACAVACTTDDYFAEKFKDLAPLYSALPQLRLLLIPADWLLNNAVSIFRRVIHWRAWRWRHDWNLFLAEVCNLLISDNHREAAALIQPPLPKSLLRRRMRLPEAFRRQDFTHHDVISLVRRFSESSPTPDASIVIVGLRTAGAYFAPLMAAYLRVPWFSIRPKSGLSPWENAQLRSAGRNNTRVLLVDDYPATGSTFRRTLGIFHKAQIRPEQISILAPTHQAQRDWVKVAGIEPPITVFTVQPEELHKAALMKPEPVEQWCGLRVIEDKSVDELNNRLAEHLKDGHHVREKRVFATPDKKILVKSVGWGWLGYHAWFAGTRLEGFVPRFIGLRHGLLVTEWVENVAQASAPAPDDRMIHVLASYVAARARRLRLTGDCRLEKRTYRWTGLDEIVAILRSAYGPYLSRLKTTALRKHLDDYGTAAPTLLDGRMTPEEWLHTPTGIYKADFEHHNFGGAEHDLTDPAYDLAAAIFEFRLARESEIKLLETYRQTSGDTTIAERIIIYKIFYATLAMRHATSRVSAGREPRKNDDLRRYAWNFLVYSMNEFCAGLIKKPKPTAWSDSLFFLDLDGVFSHQRLGFPHTTESGLQSLMLLQSNGYSVVLNTGRSVEHVRNYCEAYGISGGVAEFGSVFIDAIRQSELPIINEAGARQLEECRETVRALPDVFIDSGYQYSIRAYRYRDGKTVGLPVDEIRSVLSKPEFGELKFMSRNSDTVIVQKHTGKDTGVQFAKRYLGHAGPVAAIGDTEEDIPMLMSADYAYAPRNCSPAVRHLAKEGHCRVLKQKYQAGLLAAVQHRLSSDGIQTMTSSDFSAVPADMHRMMRTLLSAADGYWLNRLRA